MSAGRPVRLRLLAFKYGWRRVGDPFMGGGETGLPAGTGPYVAWVSPWGRYIAAEVSCLPEPLRQKVVCDQILFMTGVCPVCARVAERQDAGIACDHVPGCPVTGESIVQSASASAN